MLPLDKITHTLAGSTIAAALSPILPLPGVVVAVIVAAVGKELVDRVRGGTPDGADALITIAGGAAMLSWLSWLPKGLL